MFRQILISMKAWTNEAVPPTGGEILGLIMSILLLTISVGMLLSVALGGA